MLKWSGCGMVEMHWNECGGSEEEGNMDPHLFQHFPLSYVKDTDINSILSLFKPEIYYLLPSQIHLDPKQFVPIVIPICN